MSEPSPRFAFVPTGKKVIRLSVNQEEGYQHIRVSEDTFCCSHDSLETRFAEGRKIDKEIGRQGDREIRMKETRISGNQAIEEFKNNNFQTNKISNIKLNRSFFEIICTFEIAYNGFTIKQKKGRYGGKPEGKKL
jgi:hypothetical protein